jgi:hypothetical protein
VRESEDKVEIEKLHDKEAADSAGATNDRSKT